MFTIIILFFVKRFCIRIKNIILDIVKGKKVKKEFKISGFFFIKMIQIDNLHEVFLKNKVLPLLKYHTSFRLQK